MHRRDGLVSRAYFQPDVKPHRLRHVHRNVLPDIFLEARHGHGHFVLARGNLRQREVSRGAAGSVIDHSCFSILDFDRSRGNHRARRIDNRTCNGPLVRLTHRTSGQYNVVLMAYSSFLTRESYPAYRLYSIWVNIALIHFYCLKKNQHTCIQANRHV